MISKDLIDAAWANATEIKYKADRKWLNDLKPGDKVCRMICGTLPSIIRVTDVVGNRIECGHWTFSASWGLEIDEDLGTDGTPETLVISYIRKPTREEDEKDNQLDQKSETKSR